MQTIRRGWAATLIVASLVGIFAVEIAPPAGPLSMKACQLVTAKDVEAVLGGGYTPQSITENQIMSVSVSSRPSMTQPSTSTWSMRGSSSGEGP